MKIKSRNASFANLLWIPQASVDWISRRIGRIFEGDVDSTASSCARNLLLSLGRFLMLQHRNWWKEWLKFLLFSLLDKLLEGSRRRIQAASLACCSSWSIVFHELMLPLTELRHIPPFTEPVWATQMVSSVPLYASVASSSSSVIRWNPDLFFVGPFPNDVGYSRSCFPEKKSKKSDSIDYLCPSSYDGIGKMARLN